MYSETVAIASALGLSVGLLVHHWLKHRELKGLSRWMQPSDLDDHEDLVVILWAFSAGIAVAEWLI